MSTPPVIRYSFDPTAADPNNLVVGDIQTMPARKIRVVGPSYGPFYTKSLIITDTATNQPLTPDQFYCAELEPTATLDTGFEVMSIIMITDPSVSSSVSLQYQAVGGEYSYSVNAIIQQIYNLNLDDRPAAWPAIIGKPDAFPPSAHLHDAGDLFGFEYCVAALDRIRDAILLGDEASHDAIYKYIDNATDTVNAGIAQLQSTINNHIQNFNNPHKVTAAQVGAYTTQQSDANLNAVQNTLQTNINGVNTSLTTHINNHSNPHVVTAAQVGAYTTAQTDSAIATAVNAAKLPYTPVQQGGGANQGNNKIYIGWDGTLPRIQVDSTDIGELATVNWINPQLQSLQNQINGKQPNGNYAVQGQNAGFAGIWGTYLGINGGVDITNDLHVNAGTIYCANDIWAFWSDERLKTNIRRILDPLKKLHALDGVTYNANELAASLQPGTDLAREHMGLLAGQVKEVAPQVTNLAGFDRNHAGESISGENYQTLQYEKLVALLVEAVKAVDRKTEAAISMLRRAGLITRAEHLDLYEDVEYRESPIRLPLLTA